MTGEVGPSSPSGRPSCPGPPAVFSIWRHGIGPASDPDQPCSVHGGDANRELLWRQSLTLTALKLANNQTHLPNQIMIWN